MTMKKFLLTLLLPMMGWADEAAEAVMRQQIELLRSICTKEQADAAAPIQAEFEVPENASGEMVEQYQEACGALPYHFFGSTALALAMGDSEDRVKQSVKLPSPTTPQIMTELKERMRRSFALLPPGRRAGVSGGPGLTRETAWVCTAPRPQEPEHCDPHCYFAPEYLIGGSLVPLVSQKEQRIDGKLYLISTIALFHRGQRHEISVWADVTACPVFTEDEEDRYALNKEEEEPAYLARMQQRSAILQGIQDRNTADAAVDALNDIDSLSVMLYDTQEDNEKATLLQEQHMQAEELLEQQYYYGSALLAEYYGNTFGAYQPASLTPDVEQVIVATIRESIHKAENPLLRGICGGPGFTPETAWRVPAAVCIDGIKKLDREDDSALEQLPSTVLYPNENFESTDFAGTGVIDGKLYEKWNIRFCYQEKMYHYSMWLDYSDGRNIPDDAALKAAYEQYEKALLAQLEILNTVHDHTTADAAAKQLKSTPRTILPVQHPWCDDIVYPLPSPEINEQLQKRKNELLEQHCYQSIDLLSALNTEKWGTFTPTDEERQLMNKQWEQECLRYAELLQKLLPHVTDYESAAATAHALRNTGMNIHSHLTFLRNGFTAQQMDTAPMLKHLHRIRKADYYGSVDLAHVLEERVGPNGHPSLLQEYDEDDVSTNPQASQELEQMLRRNLQNSPYDLHRQLSGGPGFTPDTAWQIPLEMNMLWPSPNAEGFDNAASTFTRFLFKGIKTRRGATAGVLNGRFYDVQPIAVRINGRDYHANIWVDNSAGYDVRNDDETRAAMADYKKRLQQILQLLGNIQDQASADAAATHLHSIGHPTPLPDYQQTLTPEPEDNTDLLSGLYAEKLRLRDADYYGSRSLYFYCTHPLDLNGEDKEACCASQMERTRLFLQTLQRELPAVHDQASAMRAARQITQTNSEYLYCEDYYDLNLYMNSESIPCDWQALRRHTARIVEAGYYGSVNLADILIKIEFHFMHE